MARQKLVIREVLKALPPLRSTDGKDPSEVRVPVKLFNPCGAGSWYCTEFDSEERVFFGFAEITDGELGYFSLDELEGFRGPLGLGIERDLWWDPETTLADVIDGRVR
jgi:hypothetical protein